MFPSLALRISLKFASWQISSGVVPYAPAEIDPRIIPGVTLEASTEAASKIFSRIPPRITPTVNADYFLEAPPRISSSVTPKIVLKLFKGFLLKLTHKKI